MASKKRRDPDSHVPSSRPNPRTLSQFRREVVALLKAGHRIPSETGIRLVAKYHAFVRDSWQIRRAPCWVSDNIARKAHGSSRDPENPARGEVYQSKTTGNIWEVTGYNADRRRVKVKKTGTRELGELTWNPIVLRKMKQLQSRVAEEIRDSGGAAPAQPDRNWFQRNFGGSSAPIAPDMDGPARRYYVYVIESIRDGERVLYVGQSAHKPAERLLQHKRGAAYCTGCTKRSYAKGQKMRLVPEFYKGIPVIRTRAQAEKVERILARKLRSFGFTVEGGH